MGLAWFLVYWKWRACGRVTKSRTTPHGSGRNCSASTLPWGWSPEFPWSFSSGRTGLTSIRWNPGGRSPVWTIGGPLRAEPERDETGAVLRRWRTSADIEDRKRAEEKLRRD